jgi:hypothetical protein
VAANVTGAAATRPPKRLPLVAVSVNQCDGDAPTIIVALVSDRPIVELEE